MASLADVILSSDKLGLRDGAARKGTPKLASVRNSTPRPQAPPSESNGHLSDMEGFLDDEVVGTQGTDRNRRGPMDRAIPPVTDEVGERVADVFGGFLEKYDASLTCTWSIR